MSAIPIEQEPSVVAAADRWQAAISERSAFEGTWERAAMHAKGWCVAKRVYITYPANRGEPCPHCGKRIPLVFEEEGLEKRWKDICKKCDGARQSYFRAVSDVIQQRLPSKQGGRGKGK